MKNCQELPKNRKEMQDCEIMRDKDKKKIPLFCNQVCLVDHKNRGRGHQKMRDEEGNDICMLIGNKNWKPENIRGTNERLLE